MLQQNEHTGNIPQTTLEWSPSNEAIISQIKATFAAAEDNVSACISALENWTCSPEHIDAILPLLEKYPDIHNNSSLQEKIITTLSSADSKVIKLLLQRLHMIDDTILYDLNNVAVDKILGISLDETESSVDFAELHRIHTQDVFRENYGTISQTSYFIARMTLEQLQPQSSDVLYDLGSWYGRVLTYAAVNSPLQCKGIEIVPERAASCQSLKERLQLDNLSYITWSVLDQDLSDGNIFFMFNPFSQEILVAVVEQLKKVAEHKKIKIVSVGHLSMYLYRQPRLREIAPDESQQRRLYIYESR